MKTAEIELLVLKDVHEGQAVFGRLNRPVAPPGAEFPVEQTYNCLVYRLEAIQDTKNSLFECFFSYFGNVNIFEFFSVANMFGKENHHKWTNKII